MHYVTGDTHGEVARFLELKERYGLTEGDSVIVAGDFGCIPGLGTGSESKLDALAQLPFTVLFLDGNHECFPALNAYPEETWHGGRVHRIRHNVLHLMRGQVFDLGGVSVFTMGGGYSMDRASRIPGRSWWRRGMAKPPCPRRQGGRHHQPRRAGRHHGDVPADGRHLRPRA